MADTPNNPAPASPDKPAKPRKRRWRKWLIAVVVVLLLLGLLVLLAPTILSTGPVRSLVVNRLNSYVDGRVRVDDWSLGWTSGVSASGIKVFDVNNNLVLEIPRLDSQLSLLKAIRGRYDLGDTRVDVVLTRLEVDEGGRTNYERIFRIEEQKPGTTAPASAGEEQPTQLPNVSGRVVINASGRVEAAAVPQPIILEPSRLVADIPSLNQPIANTIKLASRVGNAPVGTVSLAGNVQLGQNDYLLPRQRIAVSQKLLLENLDLVAAAPFLKMADIAAQTGGVATGNLELNLQGMENLAVEGQFAISDLVFGGEILQGDVFKSSRFTLPVSLSARVVENLTLIRIDRLEAQFDQGKVVVSGQFPQEALKNLRDNRPPGHMGQLDVLVSLTDLPALANNMPRTFGLQEGVRLTGGSLSNHTTVELTADRATIRSPFSVRDLAAMRNGRSVGPLQPIEGNVQLTAIPTGSPVPSLRDVVLNLRSSFATVDGGGQSIKELKITGTYDLKRLREDLGHLLDLNAIQDGRGRFEVITRGDPITPGATTHIEFTAAASDLAYVMEGEASASAPRPPVLLSGAMDLSGAAQWDGKTLVIAEDRPATLNARNLSVQKLGTTPQNVLRERSVNLTMAGQMQFANEALQASLSQLAIVSPQLLTAQKAGDQPLVLNISSDGKLEPRGQLALEADLAALDRIAERWSGTAAPKGQAGQLQSGRLAGTVTFAGIEQPTYTAVNADLAADLAISTYQQPMQERLTVALRSVVPADLSTVSLNADVAGSSLTARVRNAQVVVWQRQNNAAVTPAPLEMVRSAEIEADVPDLPKFVAVLQTFTPPAPPAPPKPVSGSDVISQPAGVAGASAPLQVLSGSAGLKLKLTRDNQKVTISNALSVSKLSFRRGPALYTSPPDRSNTLTFTAVADTLPQAVTLLQQIQRLSVTELAGDLDIGRLRVTQPIIIERPAALLSSAAPGAAAPKVSGAFQMNGDIDPLARVLEAWQAAPANSAYPVSGEYALSQTATAQGSKITLAGSLAASRFRVHQNGQVAFSEDQLQVNNDLDYDSAAASLVLRALKIDMRSSDALHLLATGRIEGLGERQEFRDFTVRLTPDLAKLWDIVRPMLTAEQRQEVADLAIAGKQESTFTISGSYPAGRDFSSAIRTLSARGGLTVASINWPAKGLTVQNLALPVTMDDGVVRIASVSEHGTMLPAPADCNGGKLDLGGISIDLTDPAPRLTTPDNKTIAQNVRINPAVSNDLLARFIANPMFVGPSEARGLLTVNVVQCRRLPLSSLLTTSAAANDGVAEVVFTISDFRLGNAFVQTLSQFARLGEADVIDGGIRDGRVKLAGGVVTQNIEMSLGGPYTLGFNGQVRLSDMRLLPLNVQLPASLLRKIDKNLLQYLPEGVSLPISGTVAQPQLNWNDTIVRLASQAAAAALQQQILGRPTTVPLEEPATQPAPREPNPVGDLIDILTQPRK